LSLASVNGPDGRLAVEQDYEVLVREHALYDLTVILPGQTYVSQASLYDAYPDIGVGLYAVKLSIPAYLCSAVDRISTLSENTEGWYLGAIELQAEIVIR